ncbi:MAG: transglutaminase-like domain-containing protein [Verrucomicrobiales bacterium]
MRSLALLVSIFLAYLLLSGRPEAWHPALRVSLAVSALVLAVAWWGWREAGQAGGRARADRKPCWLDYAIFGAAALLVESVFLLFFASVPERARAWTTDFDELIHPERVEASEESGAGEGEETGGAVSGNWLWGEAGRRSLHRRLDARPSNRPEVYLYPDSESTGARLLAERIYLRSFALARYAAAEWSPRPFEPVMHRAEEGVVRVPGVEMGGNPVVYEVAHAERPAGRNFLLAMPGLRAAGVSSLREIMPGGYRLPPLTEGAGGYRYALESEVMNFDQLLTVENVRTLDLRPEKAADAVYLQLPEAGRVKDAVLEAAAATRGSTVLTLHQIRKALQERCTYSLEITNERDLDPLENFLLEERRGHCELFATAAALMCRAAGIPARVAYGWSGGYYFAGQNFFVFRGREAHAWTEVLLEGYGWVIFDATPVGAETAETRIAPQEEEAPRSPWQGDGEGAEGTMRGEGDLGFLVRVISWVGAVSAVALAFLLWWRRGSADEEGAGSMTKGRGAARPGYLQRFQEACRAKGVAMPVGRTLRGHLAYLREEGLEPAEGREFLAYHYGRVYGRRGRDRKLERRFERAWRSWQ